MCSKFSAYLQLEIFEASFGIWSFLFRLSNDPVVFLFLIEKMANNLSRDIYVSVYVDGELELHFEMEHEYSGKMSQ